MTPDPADGDASGGASGGRGVEEFDLIARLFAPLAAPYPGALGLTDDAALLGCPPGQVLVTTADALVAGVHFLPDDPPDLIARKALRVNLSDVAAMGARPVAVMLAACFPRGVTADWLEGFAAGLKTDLEAAGIALIGGDTVATPGPLTLAVTAFGQVAEGRALRRSAARPGDRIWVSGSIGDAALGLFVARGEAAGLEEGVAEALLDRYRLPRPRLELGPALVGLAHACMDISDGLLADLGHICRHSHVGAEIRRDQVPLSAAARAALAAGLGRGWRSVLTGGDDYELLFTAPPRADAFLQTLSRKLGLPISPIGRIIDGAAIKVLDADGGPAGLGFDPGSGGFRHFGP